jgi:hypothetical protein
VGPIKAGKSTVSPAARPNTVTADTFLQFANALLRHCDHPAQMKVASTLSPTTNAVGSATLSMHPFSHVQNRRIILVDTPGFVGSEMEDNATLRSIGTWYDTRLVDH